MFIVHEADVAEHVQGTLEADVDLLVPNTKTQCSLYDVMLGLPISLDY